MKDWSIIEEVIRKKLERLNREFDTEDLGEGDAKTLKLLVEALKIYYSIPAEPILVPDSSLEKHEPTEAELLRAVQSD